MFIIYLFKEISKTNTQNKSIFLRLQKAYLMRLTKSNHIKLSISSKFIIRINCFFGKGKTKKKKKNKRISYFY
jgi:hypothetical protein